MLLSLHACCRHYPGGTLGPLSFTGLLPALRPDGGGRPCRN